MKSHKMYSNEMAYVCTWYAYDDMMVPRESHGLMKKYAKSQELHSYCPSQTVILISGNNNI